MERYAKSQVTGKVGSYQIISQLGAGGMGEVYLAQDTRLGRKVALKLLPVEFTQNADRLRRFEQEARAASALNHPNILTIHEIGHLDDLHYMATEFVDGQTLRRRMAGERLSLGEALEVAFQLANALVAAHAAGVIHRDIKPENIMLRSDGYVKLLDFGLATLAEDTGFDTQALTMAEASTETGVLLGTVRYMSPEQARGLKVDARTDIFSLGVVLYEMIAGRSPFEGATAAEAIGAILHQEPMPLQRYVREAPETLEWIISKTLAKDREQRYQASSDLALDLKRLKQRLNLEEGSQVTVSDAGRGKSVSQAAAARTASAASTRATSGFQALIGAIRRHPIGAAIALGALILGAAVFFYSNRPPVLTDKDTILLVDFVNKTGDAVFDGTLKQALAVQLEQSPFLSLFPDARVREVLKLMTRSPDERVTAEIGREVCQRQGLKALISGTIAPLGSHYVLTLEAIDARSGEVVGRELVEAESKEQVLKALSKAASQLRGKLGESLSSIQKFNAPEQEEVTTTKLEAFKAYSLGVRISISGRLSESIPYYQRAVELDPDFAYAYSLMAMMHFGAGQLGAAARYAERAYALRDRVGEFEKLRITAFYHSIVTGDLDKRLEVLKLQQQTYPRAVTASSDLAHNYNLMGQSEKAFVEARKALSLNPGFAPAHRNIGLALLRLNRSSEAKEALERAIQQQLDMTDFHELLYGIAFIHADVAAMQRQVTWLGGISNEHLATDLQTGAAAFAGKWRQAQEFSRLSIDQATRSEMKEMTARYAAEQALRAAAFGLFPPAEEAAGLSLTRERNKITLTRAALALALCGKSTQAQTLLDDAAQRYPKDTLTNGLWLPTIRAAIELRRGDAGKAIESLLPTVRYEAAAEFWPQYLRGQAYLKLSQGKDAATEFEKILQARGQAPLSCLYPLAHLGLARAAVLTDEMPRGRQAYQDFFAIWKDADTDLPVGIEAHTEFERLNDR